MRSVEAPAWEQAQTGDDAVARAKRRVKVHSILNHAMMVTVVVGCVGVLAAAVTTSLGPLLVSLVTVVTMFIAGPAHAKFTDRLAARPLPEPEHVTVPNSIAVSWLLVHNAYTSLREGGATQTDLRGAMEAAWDVVQSTEGVVKQTASVARADEALRALHAKIIAAGELETSERGQVADVSIECAVAALESLTDLTHEPRTLR